MARLGFSGGEDGLNKDECYPELKFGKCEGNLGTENISRCVAEYGKKRQPWRDLLACTVEPQRACGGRDAEVRPINLWEVWAFFRLQ